MSFSGVYTAIITPFKNGVIDYKSFEKHIEMQIEGGVAGIVAVGTTGESPTLHMPEHSEVIKFVVKTVNGRCKVLSLIHI